MTSEPRPPSRKTLERDQLKQALKHVRDRAELHPTYLRLKEWQRLEREQLILQAADRLFLEKGYHDTSIDDIAAQVGISKGTVYLHFASKEDLVAALFDRGIHAMLETLNGILASPGAPREKLQSIIRQIYGSMDRQRFQLMGALLNSPEFHKTMVERRQAMAALWEEPRKRVGVLLEEGKASGEFDTAIPTPIMLNLFWAMLSPMMYKQVIGEGQMSADDVARHVSQFFFRGVAPGGACPLATPNVDPEGSTPA